MLNLSRKQFWAYSASAFVLATIGILSYLFLSYFTSPGPLEQSRTVFIEKGMGLSAISKKLEEEGVITMPWMFEGHLRLRQVSHQVRAGEFEFTAHQSPEQVFEVLSKGPFVQHSITIPEGTRTSDVLKILAEAPLLERDTPKDIKEGELLPETYNYTWNEPETVLVARMKHAMEEVLNAQWTRYKDTHDLKSPEEVLILASIVEKETAKADERPRIAAVFLNRLKKGMLLQSDPTVIYGLEVDHQRPIDQLSKADLQIPHAYNTYLNKGLPPAPICNPGKASIDAVLQPAETDDLYFVADGTGGHVFSRSYEEHMVNHQKWRKIRAAQTLSDGS